VGTSSTAAAAGQTALVSESARGALTSTTVTNNEIAYVETFAAGTATAALTEAGIFDASSGGDMLCRTVFSVVNKGANDSMTITWTITVS
jgi:phage-related tail protein